MNAKNNFIMDNSHKRIGQAVWEKIDSYDDEKAKMIMNLVNSEKIESLDNE